MTSARFVQIVLIVLGLMIGVQVGPTAAQSRDFMMNECSSIGQTYFRDFNARTDMRYNGQRVDGTHAINGRIFLETRFEDFACSYERNGQRMVEFFAEGRVQNAYLPGGGTSGQGSVVQVTGLRRGDTLNVRSGPGTDYRIMGALSNGTSVRNLGCQMQGNTRWCQIEMMTDMRERGWVAGRYLTLAGSAPPPASGPLETVTGVPANDVLNVRAGPGTNFRIVGALGNDSQVRNLGCQMHGNARWCQIEMQTDMRERGWVNARYLTGQTGQPTQLPNVGGAGTGASATVTRDEAACLRAVSERAATSNVTVVSYETSEANNLAMIRDGFGVTWRCLVNGGTVVEIGPA